MELVFPGFTVVIMGHSGSATDRTQSGLGNTGSWKDRRTVPS